MFSFFGQNLFTVPNNIEFPCSLFISFHEFIMGVALFVYSTNLLSLFISSISNFNLDNSFS